LLAQLSSIDKNIKDLQEKVLIREQEKKETREKVDKAFESLPNPDIVTQQQYQNASNSIN
jgi:hypothetical protein